MEHQEKKQLAEEICKMCNEGFVDASYLAMLLTKLVGQPRIATCNCTSVVGRLCNEARVILSQL
ncbi:MAG TPA: hypothetical protein PK886_03065 [Candidatus Paceibacterota bacterium]|nr:hypothetical protein [Candidatus Paceibacterota bacterium]